jgi:hypothetical protein
MPNETGIAHLSYSAIRDFLVNPRVFKKRWIDHDWNRTPALPLVEGSAFHAGVEMYWGFLMAGTIEDTSTHPMETIIDRNAIWEAVQRTVEKEYPLNTRPEHMLKKRIAKKDVAEYQAAGCVIDEVVKESANGKTTTIVYAILTQESIAKDVMENVEAYINERDTSTYMPKGIEMAVTGLTHDAETGEEHIFPLKAKLDLVAHDNGELVFIDHKYMSQDLGEGEDGEAKIKPAMKLQATAYVSLAPAILKELGIEGEVNTVIFDIFNKKSGKLTQVRYTVTDTDKVVWSRIFKSVSKKIMQAYNSEDLDCEFLPNPDDFNSDGWDEFVRDVEMSQVGEVRVVKPINEEEYEAYEL